MNLRPAQLSPWMRRYRREGGFLFDSNKSSSSSVTTTNVDSYNRAFNSVRNNSNSGNLNISVGAGGDPFGIPGGDVVVAIDGVAGYPTTTIIATVTEPRATADAPWEFTLDLDALNKNSIAAKLRGLPASVTGNASANLALDVTPGSGARYSAGTTPAGVRQSFGDEVARVARSLATPVVTVTDGAVTMQVRAPLGAIAWKVVPKLVGSAITAATIKGATSAEAIFTGSITGETVDTSFRYVATNLRVKSLAGSVRLPDGRGVAEARVVVSQAGGLSISTTTNLDGEIGRAHV